MVGLNGLQGESVIALSEFECHRGNSGGGAMFDGQNNALVAVTAKIEVGITPGVEFGRSAQGLTGTDGCGALPGVMDNGDGCGVSPLQFAQKGEQRCYVTADVLVDAMQADERIEDQQPRFERGDSLLQTRAVGLEIEPQAGRGDHLDVEIG